jgi:hypothetical protein
MPGTGRERAAPGKLDPHPRNPPAHAAHRPAGSGNRRRVMTDQDKTAEQIIFELVL